MIEIYLNDVLLHFLIEQDGRMCDKADRERSFSFQSRRKRDSFRFQAIRRCLSETTEGGNTVGRRMKPSAKCFLTKQKYILTRFNETQELNELAVVFLMFFFVWLLKGCNAIFIFHIKISEIHLNCV